ncbi:hypothetical protein [Pseudorhodoplanes sp.]|uniref:hypothetical protein n=1 Tax=Pseudorhodoplanes sp. TaxID=1934341 RepID=UPI003D12B4BA
MSKPFGLCLCGQKAPRRFINSGFELPATSPALRRSGWLFANGGFLKTAAFAALIVSGMTTLALDAVSPAYAQVVCPVSASEAIDEAQKILKANDSEKFGIALACITQALAQTRDDLEALREGNLAFTGQIHAPKGFVMTKPPSVQEGR